MKKIRFGMAAVMLAAMMTFTACGTDKDKEPDSTTSQGQESGKTTQAGEEQLTGSLDENKGFMFIMNGDDGESYVFNLEDEKLLDGYKTGDKITVTFTNGKPGPDNTSTKVVKVEKAE